jgi:hypothetical protein
MKLLAARSERDQDDIRFLYDLCGLTTADEGIQLVEQAYPAHLIPARTRFMLEEMFPSTAERDASSHGTMMGHEPTF